MTRLISEAMKKMNVSAHNGGENKPAQQPAEKANQSPRPAAFIGEDIVCFAGEDWWYHNPHSNLHIMQSFAKNNRVLFVNSIGVRAPNLKKDKFAGKRIIGKLKSLLRYFKKAEENIWVLTPVAIPLFKGKEKAIARINRFLLKAQLRFLMGKLGFKSPILWVCVPSVKDAALDLRQNAKALIYYCVDNISYYMGEKNEYIAALEEDLHRNADIAFFVNHRLVEERRLLNPNTFHLGHGTDHEHFAKANEAQPLPPDLAKIQGPRVGYIGSLRDLDWDLVGYLAKENPLYSFVFIGEVLSAIDTVRQYPNVHFLGKKSYAELPGYLSGMDCLCIFYAKENVFNEYRNPKKLLEYLSTGKPVLAIGIPELSYLGNLIETADNGEQFNERLRKLVTSDSAKAKQERMKYAAAHTWDAVAGEAAERIKKVLSPEKAGISAKA